ncbi:acetylcholine receptor subunit alpha-like isoform X2 [Ptychodera flava]|uniref:acetylcholine receptor subunit alpha-like isoform X2 n=1 Tax=Ptychodera flava TaxID=63121 RepID=UPI00396A216F
MCHLSGISSPRHYRGPHGSTEASLSDCHSRKGGGCIRVVMYSAIVLVFFTLIASSSEIGESSDQARLIKAIFDERGYNAKIRPVRHRTTVTNVTMTLVLATIIDMDERNQALKSNMWVTLEWHDEFISWNPEDYGGIENFKVPSHDVWLPDVVLYNNADDEYKNFLIKQVSILYYDGAVLWATPVIFKSSCAVDVTYFPFDVQNCTMKFGPWQHDGTEVYMYGFSDITEYESDGQWDLTSMSLDAHVEYYPDHPGIPYTDVTYHVILKRRPQYYVFNLLLPNALFTVVTVTVFYLPPESGEKISLSITILLSLTVFQLMLADFMPPSSYLPYVGYYFVGVMILVSMSLVSSVLVVNIHFGNSEEDGMPAWVRRLFMNQLAPLLNVRKAPPKVPPFQSNISSHRLEELKRTPKYLHARMSNGDVLIPLVRKYSTDRHYINSHHHHTRKIKSNPCDESEIIIEILEEVRKVSKFHEAKKREEVARRDWKIVAMVLDKIFLVVYIFGSIIAAVVFAGQMST